ncbi:MAG: hypothetical protein JO209_01805 [Acidisphaera sp.]|nr:hypothetical protein [Acidisphaera sp.]
MEAPERSGEPAAEAGARADSKADTSEPWWKAASASVPALAFALSLFTAGLSIYTARNKDINDQRAELSRLTEKILLYPVSTQIALKQAGADYVTFSDQFSSELSLTTQQAYLLATSLGGNTSTQELVAIANSMVNLERYTAAKRMAHQAVAVADNFFDEIGALRQLSDLETRFAEDQAEREQGAQDFERALRIGDRYPEVARNAAELAYTNAQTELVWGRSTALTDCADASRHFGQSMQMIQPFNLGSTTNVLRAQNLAWLSALTHCEQNRLPFAWVPPLVPPPAPPQTAPFPSLSPPPAAH